MEKRLYMDSKHLKLNLGCGSRFEKDWINIDFHSYDPAVRAYNLLKGIPLNDNSVEFVYHSHLLEHFLKRDASFLMAECMRVLKPGGIIRVVVPDLENIVRAYIKSLGEVERGIDGAVSHYEWMKIELLDQLVREKSGGEMLTYLSAETLPAKEFIINRLGVEARRIMEDEKDTNIERHTSGSNAVSLRGFLQNLQKLIPFRHKWREYLLRLLLGEEYYFLNVGRFRYSGEIHHWMYDSYSLKKELKIAGFEDIVQRTAQLSYLQGWEQYNLDVESDGSIYKPDSLYMEGIKPIHI